MKMFKKIKELDKSRLLDSTERYENAYYEYLRNVIDRLFSGFFIFKTRKGELLAGASTFFTIMSLSPLLLLIITFYGKIVGDVDKAYFDVMNGIKENVPHLAPWIVRSIEKIIKTQLSKDSLNWANILLLLYTGSGLSGTLVFGMNNIADVKQKGGWLVETFKSFISATFITSFIIIAMAVSFQKELIVQLVRDIPVMSFLVQYASKSFVQVVLFSILFTIYFKYITPKKIRIADGLYGAAATISSFMAAKSFYWVYLHYMKSDLQMSFGNFYTIIIAVLFIYFMICSFFFGASVAFAPTYQRVKLATKSEESSESTPDLPKIG